MNHGTSTAYEKYKCRCEACTTRHNARVAKNRADRLARGRISHGTRSGYDAGCRCNECRRLRAVITKRERMDSLMSIPGHNHKIREVKTFGMCPTCDEYLVRTNNGVSLGFVGSA